MHRKTRSARLLVVTSLLVLGDRGRSCLGDRGRSCLTEPRALIVRPRPPGGLEPPEPKVRRLAGGSSPPSPLYDPGRLVRPVKQPPAS